MKKIIDTTAQRAVLRECGKACAASYTAEIFRKARAQSADIQGFLDILTAKFPEARYKLLASGAIQVRYTHCACDLVQWGWVKTPLICRCSAYNLKENFERAWGVSVDVKLESSILAGASQCLFIVSLENPPEEK